ncbi:HAAS signaling domain-containing protein [Lederbergia lenta]|uniref:Predicted membrane protein n=1 Tax=Lederbergia lenta TaxID=1467 RepID=A0A2X4WHS9_LEDLE|nr:Predicted membrane protein [Lederbergia lenta]
MKFLESGLKFMIAKEKRDIVDEYILHFAEEGHKYKSEEEISKELGNPEEIAKELNAVYAINKVEENKSIRSMFTALLSIMGLNMMNCIIIIVSFFVLLILLPFILAYIIGVPFMILSPLILIVMGFINGFNTIGFGEISESIKGIMIGTILAFLGYFIGKFIVRLMIKYLRWNMLIARGK